MKQLIICEKPSQAKDLAPVVGARTKIEGGYSGDGVIVTHGFGHMMEQAKPEAYAPSLKQRWDITLLPVVPTTWQMQVKVDGAPQYRRIVKFLGEASEVIIATDADREGEVIAREIMDAAGYQGPIRRLWTAANDPASLKKAFANLLPGQKTLSLYHSGVGRAHADWLGGMNLTMALTAAFGTGGKDGTVHFGRVQTPVLGLVVRRERVIRNFIPKPHFLFAATFELAKTSVVMKWQARPELLDKDGHVVDRAKLQAVVDKIRQKMGRIDKHETKPESDPPPLPYYLGSLQKEASTRFGIKPTEVLKAAQALYEKHKATTYPRTDCEYLPTSIFSAAGDVISALAHIDPTLRALTDQVDLTYKSRAWDDAKITSSHYAIIPTGYAGVDLKAMSVVERKVYDLIRLRYLAQFLGTAEFNKTVIEVVCEQERFSAAGRALVRPGWLRAYPEKLDKLMGKGKKEDKEEAEQALPHIGNQTTSQNLTAEVKQTKTTAPKRYTEASMLTAMESVDKEIDDPRLQKIMRNKEKAGIGTDATRGAILDNLFDREYMSIAKKEIIPTEKGEKLIGLLESIAPELADPVLTALWEDRLKQVEDGTCTLQQFDGEMANWVNAIIVKIKTEAAKSDRPRLGPATTGSQIDCPDCKKPMRRIKGPKGYFWGCTGYQDGCKATLPDMDGKPGLRLANASNTAVTSSAPVYPCPNCRKPMRPRNGPSGAFWGCSGYPNCKHSQPDAGGKPGVRPEDASGKSSYADTHEIRPKPVKQGKVGDACPDCKKGLLIAKTTKDNKPFVGCNGYPTCRFFKWP